MDVDVQDTSINVKFILKQIPAEYHGRFYDINEIAVITGLTIAQLVPILNVKANSKSWTALCLKKSDQVRSRRGMPVIHYYSPYSASIPASTNAMQSNEDREANLRGRPPILPPGLSISILAPSHPSEEPLIDAPSAEEAQSSSTSYPEFSRDALTCVLFASDSYEPASIVSDICRFLSSQDLPRFLSAILSLKGEGRSKFFGFCRGFTEKRNARYPSRFAFLWGSWHKRADWGVLRRCSRACADVAHAKPCFYRDLQSGHFSRSTQACKHGSRCA